MTPDATAVAPTPTSTADLAPTAALLTLEERTRASADVAEGLRPLIALARRAPALVAIAMESFDEAVRNAQDKGIEVAPAALLARHAARARVAE
jgi:hypothetical protein